MPRKKELPDTPPETPFEGVIRALRPFMKDDGYSVAWMRNSGGSAKLRVADSADMTRLNETLTALAGEVERGHNGVVFVHFDDLSNAEAFAIVQRVFDVV